ncbi:HetP family heterocyst commitment protein [[Phormidium] sp. ETS-05]|uniref:HetP family heterocyst commitment protein n=1 Tax=[Phormidium] sp. ETS-05 TaxID=222819 RepID=UPI0018EEEE22|nr:HetP family heterocyst commitment protein [[Phormidium] sp. ETS-05]
MSYTMSSPSAKLDRIMTTEQFDLVVDAILAGKYSWACVLILRFGGYNPLHYIPYRTYNRLMKESRQGVQESGHRTSRNTDENYQPLEPANPDKRSEMKDLAYIQSAQNKITKFGGTTIHCHPH